MNGARLEAVNGRLERHDDAATAFLERVNGTATVISKDAILIEDDVACGTMGCGDLTKLFARRPPLSHCGTSPNLKNRGERRRRVNRAGGGEGFPSRRGGRTASRPCLCGESRP